MTVLCIESGNPVARAFPADHVGYDVTGQGSMLRRRNCELAYGPLARRHTTDYRVDR